MDRKIIAEKFAEELKKEYPDIVNIWLYGSVSSERDEKDSDIDILLVCTKDSYQTRKKVSEKIIDYLLQYGVYLSVKAITKEEYDHLRETHFYSVINDEGIMLG